MPTERTVRLRVICLNPPADECYGKKTVFGLQDKEGLLQPGKRSADGGLVFECELRAKAGTGNSVNFLGTYTHGTPTERFLYLSYRLAEGNPAEWIKRIKVPLKGIRWEEVEQADATGQIFEVVVEGKRSGTVSPIRNWQIGSE